MILKINNKKVDFFDSFSLNLAFNSVASTFSFDGYFNPDNPEHRAIYKPGTYQRVTLEHNGELLLTGTMLSSTFNSGPNIKTVPIGGYSLPGVLEDSDIPTSMYPLQSDGRTLQEITERLIKPFGIKLLNSNLGNVEIANIGKKLEKSTAKESQNIKSYITSLAAQKNIIVSHDEFGNLLFTKAQTNKKPILDFDGGVPETEMSLSFNGQGMHNNITVIKQASVDGGNAGESAINNPYVSAYRSSVKNQNSGDDNDTPRAARYLLSNELRNIKLAIQTDRWEVDGKIIKPNNLITVINPNLYIFKKTNFFIESINFIGDKEKTIATLNCVLPEVYNGQTPKNIFN